MWKDTRNALISAGIFQFISRTKGLGEKLTTPRDTADILIRKASTEAVSR